MTKHNPHARYLIMGDCRGSRYYLKASHLLRGRVPEFSWQGLRDNGTLFVSAADAEDIIQVLLPQLKLTPVIIEI